MLTLLYMIAPIAFLPRYVRVLTRIMIPSLLLWQTLTGYLPLRTTIPTVLHVVIAALVLLLGLLWRMLVCGDMLCSRNVVCP